ncbi:biotin/lipoyl-binding protein [Candidatus Woesearchaeota archaeon]|nr:biotin/lipoyl-binding protein [Candidatus Woesearchaeota archaeon]
MQDLKVNINGEEYRVKVEEASSGKLNVYFDGEKFEVETKSDIEKQLFDEIERQEKGKDKGVITAPMPGVVFSVDVKVGDDVKKGQKVIGLMAMKMENEVCAPASGKVKQVKVRKGDSVNKGDILVVL